MLLAAGADPNKEHDGCHPIHTALKVKSDACAATLLEFHPEQVHVRDSKYGGTPLHWAKTKEVDISHCSMSCGLLNETLYKTNGRDVRK